MLKTRNNKKTPPACEHCGKPATRRANLAVNVHWFNLAEDDLCDGDLRVQIGDVVSLRRPRCGLG